MEYVVWNADPILLSLGSLKIHWYGFLFAMGFIVGIKITEYIFKIENKNKDDIDKGLIYVMIGTVVGARLGHCLFYDPAYYLSNPLEILMIQKGGLASHGGAIGVLLGLYLFTKANNYSYIWLLDRVVIPTALVGAFIRMGNLFNSEIIGDETTVPWAIVFERVDGLPRHPTQLYEAFSYVIIFAVLFLLYKKYGREFKAGTMFGIYMVLTFGARFMIEFVKTQQENYTLDLPFNTGQLLSIPFIILGLFMIFVYKKGSVSTQKE
ncbi:MAG: prolipoprotein diacylglyceryl transferase [Campylobacterales bacterium]|nr:prolipoprotein diacylglyceryl transferase [Campylobacterales bacterium]